MKNMNDIDFEEELRREEMETKQRIERERTERAKLQNNAPAEEQFKPINKTEEKDFTSIIKEHVPYYLLYFVAAFIVTYVFIYKYIGIRVLGYHPIIMVIISLGVTGGAIVKDYRHYKKVEQERIDRGLK